MRRLAPALILAMIAETADYSQMNNDIMMVVMSVIPILVVLLVLRMLFKSFNDISKMNAVRYAKGLALLMLLAQTNTTGWSTNMDVWSTITDLVILVIPFLVLIIVLRSIFRYFTREW